jgi:type IV pilus biogenesis protein CpaD/CtpE
MRIRIGMIAAGVLAAALALAPAAQAQQPAVQDPAKSKEVNTQAYISLLRANLRENQENIIREAMNLTTDQAAAFWPIYREYSAAQTKLGDEKLAIINEYVKNYLTMSDAKAADIAKRTIELDDQRTALRKKYFGIVNGKLGGVLALRFFELEHQMQLILDLQMASNLPIVQGPATGN